jgi:hypothetical protein
MINVRAELTNLQMNSQLIQSALVEFNYAEQAVKTAEEPITGKMLGRHLMFIADRKVDIAEIREKNRMLALEHQQRNEVKLAARNRDIAMARNDAMLSKADAGKLSMETDTERNRSQ